MHDPINTAGLVPSDRRDASDHGAWDRLFARWSAARAAYFQAASEQICRYDALIELEALLIQEALEQLKAIQNGEGIGSRKGLHGASAKDGRQA